MKKLHSEVLTFLSEKFLTPIGKSWKTHPEYFPNFQFPGCDADGFLENSSSIFSKCQFPGHEIENYF